MAKKDLKNSHLYLYTIDEARALLRMDRKRFVNDFLKSKKIPVTVIDGRDMIQFGDLQRFFGEHKFYYKT